jgi:hypothetical protein
MAIGFFDGNKADASPESIKRKRALIAQLLRGNSRAPQNVGEGFNAIGNNIAAAITSSRANAAEQANEAERSRIMAPLFGGGGAPMASAGNPVATGSGATRMSRGGPVDPAIRDGIATTASSLGIDPVDLATAISYETGGTFDPTKRGPTTQWGQHKGLIQFGQPQAKQHGVDWNNPVGSQLGPNGAVASYLRSTGVRPGMGLLDIYSAINAGGVGRYNRSDANNGGAPGTVRDKVEQQMAGHRARAMAMFQPPARPVQTASAGPQSNDAQMQDGAGELQAGGSEMMGGGYNPFQPRDMAPPADAMGQGIADNEEQTRMMEAQMAAEQGLPYAGNEPGPVSEPSLLSPIPMGLGDNPFLPREPDAMAQAPAPAPMPPQMDRATFDAITGQMPPAPSMDRRNFDQITSTGAPLNPAFMAEGISPSWGIGDPNAPPPVAQEVSGPAPGPFPTPPRRPANLGLQSPFVPPAMRQPMSMDFGGENSGGAMQFIESEFARREGRPDPRTAMGAPPAQIYNAFVPQASQMPAGGGSVQGVSQGGAMASGPAQAPAQAQQGGMITPDQLRTVMMSRIPDADKRFVLDMYNQQQARAQAEAERARVEAQNRQTAEALNIDPRLGGVAPTNDQKDLAQANKQRREAGLPILRMDEYKLQKAKAGATSITNNAGAKADDAFGVETSKALAKRFDEMVGDGDVAAQNLELVTELRRLGGRIDFGAPAVAKGLLGRFGIKTEGISDIEAFNTLINRLTPQQRLPGSGATSDFDAKMFKESLPQLMNTPEGNKLIIDTIEKVSQNRMARGEIAMRVQMGELDRKDGIAELRRLQAEARSMSDVVRDFGKKKPPPNAAPGTTSAPPPSQQGQPSQAEIEAEMKRRGLR